MMEGQTMHASGTVEMVRMSSYADAREALRHRDLREATHEEALFLLDNTVLVLHADAHTRRRRVENRAFRRDILGHFERDQLVDIFEETLAPFLQRGEGNLVEIAHRLVMNLSATVAGIDRPLRTSEETDRLYHFLSRFSEGATIIDSTRDKDTVRGEVLAALEDFKQEFYAASEDRRRALLADQRAGKIGEEQLPRDVLTTLLRYQDELGVGDELLPREVALYLVGAHTAANQITHLVHELLKWTQRREDASHGAAADLRFIQRCMLESVRLNPPAPSLLRTAPDVEVMLRTGRRIPPRALVDIDLLSANRDESVFGPDASEFNPWREVGAEVHAWGLSFGAGTHVCIGQEMAAGQPTEEDVAPEVHLYGAVPRLVHMLFEKGLALHPERKAVGASHTRRREWGDYPVVFR
jgi:cytochrome P450